MTGKHRRASARVSRSTQRSRRLEEGNISRTAERVPEPANAALRAGIAAIAAPAGDHRRDAVGAAAMPRLQRTFGNRAVQRLVLQRQMAAAVQREGEEEEVQTLRAPTEAVEVGAGGDLGAQIRARAGGGRPLEPGVQRRLEKGLGADLSQVRVHTDGEADKMARSVHSVAFTSGRDIYFRQGAFDTGSETGLQTLAHEATHVVQQASGPVAGAPRAGGVSVSDPSDRYEQAAEAQAHALVRAGTPAQTSGNQAVLRKVSTDAAGAAGHLEPAIQRKLNWLDTDWGGARYLDASSGGGGGVLFVGEAGTEVVVKPGEEMAAEAAMAALFQNEVSGKGGITLAPGLRVASPVEGRQIKSALEPLLDQVGANAPDEKGTKGKAFKKDRAANLVGKLDQPGVVIQDLARGGEMKDVLAEVKKHTKKKFFGGRKLRKESPLRIFQDVRSIKALGQATAVDLFTGNRDRLLGFYNAENFMVTPYSVTMIDNIWMGTEASYFQTTQVEGRGGKKFTITADEGMAKWKSDAEVKALAAGNYDAISTLVFTKISENAAADTRDVDAEAFKKIMNKNKATFIKTFSEGLAAGKQSLVQSINRILQDPQKLRKIVPGVDLAEIVETMRKRKVFLEGGG